MKNYVRVLVTVCYVGLLPIQAYAEAPVVDESENYALMDGQRSAYEQPVGRQHRDSFHEDEEIPLAREQVEQPRHGNNATLLDKVQGLQQEIQELRGQLEVQSHDLKLLQQQQIAFYKDLDARLNHTAPATKAAMNTKAESPTIDTRENLTAASSAPVAKTPSPSTSAPVAPIVTPVSTNSANNPAEEQISYFAAYEMIKKKRYDEALVAMEKFVAQYPKGGYTANAQYWLGELYMVKKDYAQAIKHFEIVLQQFPSSSKASASLLKIGYALAESGKAREAIRRLQQVVKNYPDTNTAQLAKAKLESLGSY